jgi:hypothetical protein
MPLQTFALVEAMLEKALERRACRDDGSEAIPDITWRQYAELAPQPPGAPAFVGDRHDRADVIAARGPRLRREIAQAFQQGWQSRTAADRDDARRSWHGAQLASGSFDRKAIRLDASECRWCPHEGRKRNPYATRAGANPVDNCSSSHECSKKSACGRD